MRSMHDVIFIVGFANIVRMDAAADSRTRPRLSSLFLADSVVVTLKRHRYRCSVYNEHLLRQRYTATVAGSRTKIYVALLYS